jgi:hypothetical protein
MMVEVEFDSVVAAWSEWAEFILCLDLVELVKADEIFSWPEVDII